MYIIKPFSLLLQYIIPWPLFAARFNISYTNNCVSNNGFLKYTMIKIIRYIFKKFSLVLLKKNCNHQSHSDCFFFFLCARKNKAQCASSSRSRKCSPCERVYYKAAVRRWIKAPFCYSPESPGNRRPEPGTPFLFLLQLLYTLLLLLFLSPARLFSYVCVCVCCACTWLPQHTVLLLALARESRTIKHIKERRETARQIHFPTDLLSLCGSFIYSPRCSGIQAVLYYIPTTTTILSTISLSMFCTVLWLWGWLARRELNTPLFRQLSLSFSLAEKGFWGREREMETIHFLVCMSIMRIIYTGICIRGLGLAPEFLGCIVGIFLIVRVLCLRNKKKKTVLYVTIAYI